MMFFPLCFVIIKFLVLSQAVQLPFTLRSQIDGNILKAVEYAEKVLSETPLNQEQNATKSESMVEMTLKPLYFRLDDFSVQLSDLRLTSSDFTVEETDWDVLGHRLMPVAFFKWIQINGKIKTSQGSASPDKYSFRLIQNDVRGKGIVSLNAELREVTWSYFNFKENATVLEFQSNEGDPVGMIPVRNTNGTEFSELLSLKLQRDVNHQLTQLVTKRINQTLYKNSRISDLDPYADEIRAIDVNNTENANSLIDNILKVGRVMIRNKFADRVKIPDIQEQFAEKYVITFRGSFKATEGSAIGISSVYRVGDIVFGYDNESQLHFYGTLGFEALHLYYEQYKAEIWGMGPSGSLDTTLSPLSVLVHIHLNTTSKKLSLNRFKVANVGDLSVSLTGLGGTINWLVSRVASWVVGMYRDQVLTLLESQYEQYVKDVFAEYNIEQLLNGEDREPNELIK